MKKITAYTWAFILLLVAFLTAGMFTLGSVKTTGGHMTVVKNNTVYYELSSSVSLKAVYVNIGAVHAPVGSDVTVTVKTSTSTNVPSKASFTTLGSAVKIGNVTGENGKEGALYNWIAIAENQSKSVRKISLVADANLDLNEIVCVNRDNEIIPLNVYSTGTVYSETELLATLDSQDTFLDYFDETGKVVFNNNAYANLTQEEGYYMSAVQNLLAGKETYADSVYTLDGNFNYLATVFMAPFVAVFGNSAFALRLPALLATFTLIAFAFLLMQEMTKSDQYAFWFALVLMLGGMATTVGRFGAPYMMIASALVASLYFMYRFFAHGISSKRIVRGGMNVFVSGMFAAAAMAMDITAIIPVAGILVLFGFGLHRQKLAYGLALKKLAGKAAEDPDGAASIGIIGEEANRAKAVYAAKNRVSYGFAALSFAIGTAVLILLAGIFAYSAYVRANNDQTAGFLTMIWNGVKASACDNGVTAFSADNATSVFAWWLPFKSATLYKGVSAAASGTYLGWRVLPNVAATYAAFAAFLGMTVKIVIDFVKKRTDKNSLRMRRTYFVLLGGMVAAMLAGACRGNASALSGMLFHVFYLGFLPLAAMLLPEAETREEKVLVNAICGAVVLMTAIIFVFTLPSMYGYAVTASQAKWFNWMSILSNG